MVHRTHPRLLLLILVAACSSPAGADGEHADASPFDARPAPDAEVSDRLRPLEADSAGSDVLALDSAPRDAPALDQGLSDPPGDAGGLLDAPPPSDGGRADVGPIATVTFQEGTVGYAGTRSIAISTYGGLGAPGAYNANGATFADADNDWCVGTSIAGSPAYDEVWLLRFEDLAVPATATVVGATLTIAVYPGDRGDAALSLDYLARGWSTAVPASCAGCFNAPVGWRYRDGPGAPWDAPGASGAVDVRPGGPARIPSSGFLAPGYAPVPVSIELDPSIVASWLRGENHGLRIGGGTSGVHFGFVQANRDPTERNVGLRPRLTIRYAPG